MTFHTTDGLRPVMSYPQGIAITAIPFTRQAIGDEIERLIGLLDAADADPDLEPAGDELDASYPEGWASAGPHPHEDDEPTLGASCDHHGGGSQEHWSEANDNNEREIENEHGGDINDEPHDDDEGGRAGYFDGAGCVLAAQQLRQAKPRRRPQPDIIGERAIPLPNGGVMRVFVPASSGYVVRP